MKNYTSLEQSKQLIAAGLDPNTADMDWIYEYLIGDYNESPYFDIHTTEAEDLPCWSVGGLIAAINSDYTFGLAKDGKTYSCLIAGKMFDGDNLVDVLVEVILWLLEEGRIKKGE